MSIPKANANRPPLLARVCVNCPVCRRARRMQRGLAFGFVRKIERKLCPFCRAYESAFGRRPHEPMRRAPSPTAS